MLDFCPRQVTQLQYHLEQVQDLRRYLVHGWIRIEDLTQWRHHLSILISSVQPKLEISPAYASIPVTPVWWAIAAWLKIQFEMDSVHSAKVLVAAVFLEQRHHRSAVEVTNVQDWPVPAVEH